MLGQFSISKKNGREVLREIKQDPDLRRIPVVIMTMSDDQKDIDDSYDLHANCYVTKPVDLDRFMGFVRQIEDFWLTVVKLPAA
jgi:two-component system, chemotaxis family, response regulator Rcp1